MSIIIIAVIFAIVVCVALLLIGKYFVVFALQRGDFDFSKFGQAPRVDESGKKSAVEILRTIGVDWAKTKEKEIWTMRSFDGLTLDASFFKNEGSHKYVCLVHGYRCKKEDMFIYAKFFFNHGFNVLASDNRASGESEGNTIDLGFFDSSDLKNWTEKIVKRDPLAQIALFGLSMGGATVMMASGLELPENVKCIVEDSGWSSAWDEFSFILKRYMHLPSFPVLNVCDLMCKKICKYSFKECSAVERLKTTKVPALFIHGTDDDFVPCSLLDKNIEAYNGPYKEVYRVEGAKHGSSHHNNPEVYEEKVLSFVDKFI